jgi:L-fucose isomerase-like protein
MSSTIEVPAATQTAASKTQKPVGVLILGRKRPGFDQEWNKIICKRAVVALENLGYTCIGQDAPMLDDATLQAALEGIRAAGCDSLVMLQPSMGNGQLAFSLSQAWTGPIVLWATPERPGDGKVSSCSLVGQHLWGSMLRQAGHPFELVYGDPDDAPTRTSLVRAINLSRTALKLRTAKIGVIGTYAPGFIDLAADPFLLRRSLGLQLHALSLPQFIERVNGFDEAAVREDIEQVRKLGLPLKDVTEEDLAVNSRVYLAMRQLMQEESLSGLCVQCWPELPEMIGQWPYLAISRLTAEGLAVAMEGDVDGAIAELMGNSLGLGNAFLTDWLEHDDNTVFLWHPGMAPLDMCYAAGETNGPCLAKHFNIVKPLVVDGALRTGNSVTIVRLWRCDGEYRMTAFEGKSITSQRNLTGNTVLVKADDAGLMKRFDTLVHEGMPHHVLLYNSHCAETFRRLARILNIHWIA